MEGSYSKVWNAREEAPAEEYKFFVDSLMGTIRYVISLRASVGPFCLL
jgi:26S proteasome regulatory subunit N12